MVKALTGRGEPLGEAAFAIGESARAATAQFDLPLEIRNQVARIEIAGERSAGAVYLLDARSQWHRVGIVSGESREAAQPLLSPLYYVERALSPYADIITPSEGNVANAVHDLIQQKVSTIVLADIGKLVAGTQEELEAWVKSGGVLIRFAGPRLEQGGDELLPVALRRGGRSLGGSLSWSTPQPLAPFEEKSPFRGLAVPGRREGSTGKCLPIPPWPAKPRSGRRSPTARRWSPPRSKDKASSCSSTSRRTPTGRICRCRDCSWRCCAAS